LEHTVVLNNKSYPYQVNRSTRARYLRIKLARDGVITLVIPKGISFKSAEAFLESRRSWLERNLQNLPEAKPFSETRPTRLDLLYIDESWGIDYHLSTEASVQLKQVGERELALSGAVEDKDLVQKALGKWLKAKATESLSSQLATLAELHGFHYNRVSIRGQKTRWGSCSSLKNINLNYKLLFLEQPLVDYVLIHELCHTIEMNHSRRFWSLVADCDINYKHHDRLLNEVGRAIPI